MESEDSNTGSTSSNTNSNEETSASKSNSTREESSSSESEIKTHVSSSTSKRKIILSDDSDEESSENAPHSTEVQSTQSLKSPAVKKTNIQSNSTSSDDEDTKHSKFITKASRIRQLSSSEGSDADDKTSPFKKSKLTNQDSNNSTVIQYDRVSLTKMVSPLTSSSLTSSPSDNESTPSTSVRKPSARTKEREAHVKDKFDNIVKLLEQKNDGYKASSESSNSNPDGNSIKTSTKSSGSSTSSSSTSSSSSGSSKSDSNEDSDLSSDNNIKKLIKKKHHAIKSDICDPDTSDDENEKRSVPHIQKRKQTKLTSPKPIRMSAKEAMDNMQKIKSESNRMLREKEVSLPYHRPKALSLKDIMNRRKPALTSDGKAMPLKMNEEQLKQYAMMLEERQKEMMELCKSDTDDDDGDNENDQNATNQTDITNDNDSTNIQSDNGVDKDDFSNNIDKVDVHSATDTIENVNDSDITKNAKHIEDSDKTFDEMILTNSTSIDKNGDKTGQQLETNAEDNDIKVMSIDMNSKTCTEMEVDVNNIHKSIDESNSDKNEMEVSNTSRAKEINATSPIVNEILSMKDNNDCLLPDKELIKSNTEQSKTEKDSQLISLHFDSEKSNTGNTEQENKDEATIEVNNDALIAELKTTSQEQNTEKDSQLISLHFDSESTVIDDVPQENKENIDTGSKNIDDKRFSLKTNENQDGTSFSDDDDDGFNEADIDNLIENADAIKEKISVDSPMLIREIHANSKPKITGIPGSLIDLDGTDPTQLRKCTGVELLKQRFIYFSNLKTHDELEREKELRIKPGFQHLKLKQELEDQIADQRCLEWNKRIEEEKQQKQEANTILDDDEDDLDKIEQKLENDDKLDDNHETSDDEEESVEEPPENDIDMTDKPKKRNANAMLDDEAEESECDDNENEELNNDDGSEADSESSDSSDSEPEVEVEGKKKGRIIKAFEDSDDENDKTDVNQTSIVTTESYTSDNEEVCGKSRVVNVNGSYQDEELQSGQINKINSEDLFSTQDTPNDIEAKTKPDSLINGSKVSDGIDKRNNDPVDLAGNSESILGNKDKIDVICETQPLENTSLDDVAAMCSGKFSQDAAVIETQSQEKDIGDDILELCTGKFYDNKFVTQSQSQDTLQQDSESILKYDNVASLIKDCDVAKENSTVNTKNIEAENTILKSILDELDGPDFDAPKQNKYFDNVLKNKENSQNVANGLSKKRYMIDSDDEENVDEDKTKKRKKRKLADRALQISDDEEELEDAIEDEESEIDDDEQTERVVEYDSEENEVVIVPQQQKKKKRRIGDFFEQEAELTSEDEWVGSGDEDEAGLDMMEQEEGDKDKFHQGMLRRELEQIHMREVMDQDKREVRLLQELLFEDGDLGSGHRQRKFRWRNADGEDVTGTNPDQLPDTQDEEMESEEVWRKERHEREVFLRSLTESQEDSPTNITLTRKAIIKANLTRTNTMSALLCEETTVIATESTVLEKRTSKEVPSPVKKAFPVQQYRGSLLARGRSTLDRLAALATPLAGDGEGPKAGSLPPSSKRNFVFATVSPSQDKNKISKRKVEENPDTPRLLKKMKTEIKQNGSRSSLLEHFKV